MFVGYMTWLREFLWGKFYSYWNKIIKQNQVNLAITNVWKIIWGKNSPYVKILMSNMEDGYLWILMN